LGTSPNSIQHYECKKGKSQSLLIYLFSF